MTTTEVPRYAVLFKTHFWDAFTQRQLARLTSRVNSGDVFVVVDETAGPVSGIEAPRVVRLTEASAVASGLPAASTETSVFWYSVDYPHYIFFEQQPHYDYYLTLEYDALIDTDIDRLISEVARDGVDYLGHPFTQSKHDWPWFQRHLEIYEASQITLGYSCIAVFSNRAMQLLHRRRLDMARQFENGELTYWPNNEAFLPTEVELAGLRRAQLPDYGSSKRFNWWPPTFEGDLPAIKGEVFMHPVLEGARYVRSVLRHEPHFINLLSRHSAVRSRLAKMPADFYRPFIYKEFRRRLAAAIRRRLARLGLAQHWTVGAESPKALKRKR
jgi:hypothetical protein